MDSNTQIWLIVFVGLTGAAVLLQAFVLLGILISLRKTAKRLADATDDLKGTVIPLVQTSRSLVERVTPQVLTVAAGLAELTQLVQKESNGVRVSVAEISERVSRQTARLDAMLTVGLDAVEKAAGALEHSVAAPVRQANGIMAAIKATVDTYRKWTPSRRAAVSTVPLRANAPIAVYPDPDRDIVS